MPLSAFQPQRYQALLAAKVATVCDLLAPFAPPAPAVFPSPPQGFRMRAEFRMWHQGDGLDYVMFRPGEPKTPVPIHRFPIACERIQALMPALLARLRVDRELRRKLFQAEFLSSLTGDTLVTLVYHRPLDERWQAAADNLAAALGVSLVGRSRGQKQVIGRDYVEELLSVAGCDYRYRQYEQSFTQPNARINIAMLEWACEQAAVVGGNLLELYCGNGNFTLPLAAHFGTVVATEVAKSAVRSAGENLAANGIDNVYLVRLSASEVAEAMAGTRPFRRLAGLPVPLAEMHLDTLLVDPPRAGLDDEALQLAAGFGTLLYISCNPQTLAGNLRTLTRSHRIDRFALFDQFPYTPHMECGLVLRRRTASTVPTTTQGG